MIIIDCEGDPVQELSALYVNDATLLIEDVFHRHVHYPFSTDCDAFARRHVHGLDFNYLRQAKLPSLGEVLDLFCDWLQTYPADNKLFAHAPAKEKQLLSLHINDVCLKPWAERIHCHSHRIALQMKVNSVKVCGVTCPAASIHSHYVNWKPKNVHSPSPTDEAKMDFRHHCSLYDCVEVYLAITLNGK